MNLKKTAGWILFGGLTALAALGSNPGRAYTLLGGSLPLNYRDFRFYNNFADPTANDNKTPNANFPGSHGAEMSAWKAAMEWSSRKYADGKGDPTQAQIGDGGANFDFIYMGLAPYIQKQVGSNMIFAVSTLGSGVLGATFSYQGGYPPGWYMAISDAWKWDDGPGYHSLMDLQGVFTHELGHSLRLGHTSVRTATMYYAIYGNGIADRSIEPDDIAGCQAIYGKASASKPEITGTSGSSRPGQTMIILGKNFAPTGNEVWFTSGGSRTPAKAFNVSSTGGGTKLTFTVPMGAKIGNVAVKIPGSSHSSLSNAWPFDPTKVTFKPQLTSLSPAKVRNIKGGLVTVTGKYLSGATKVTVGPLTLTGSQFKVVSDTSLQFNAPDPPPALGTIQVTVSNPLGTSNALNLTIEAADPPVLLAPAMSFMANKDTFQLGSKPKFLGLVLLSLSNKASSIPGLISLGLGNNFNELVVLTTVTFDKVGRTSASFIVPAGLGGKYYYSQLAVIDPSNPYALPVKVSGVAKTLILF